MKRYLAGAVTDRFPAGAMVELAAAHPQVIAQQSIVVENTQSGVILIDLHNS